MRACTPRTRLCSRTALCSATSARCSPPRRRLEAAPFGSSNRSAVLGERTGGRCASSGRKRTETNGAVGGCNGIRAFKSGSRMSVDGAACVAEVAEVGSSRAVVSRGSWLFGKLTSMGCEASETGETGGVGRLGERMRARSARRSASARIWAATAAAADSSSHASAVGSAPGACGGGPTAGAGDVGRSNDL